MSNRSPEWPAGAVICLVTPGRARSPEEAAELSSYIDSAIEAGVDLVQVREPLLPARALAATVEAAVEASRNTITRVIVNDRVDVAITCRADGVQLGARSLPPRRVREMAGDRLLIGRSVHSVEEARQESIEGVASYLIAGTVFATKSKPGETRLLGTDGLAAVVQASAVPVLAIGGIDLAAVPSVAATGVSGFAAIGLFATADRLHRTVQQARTAFDRAKVIP